MGINFTSNADDYFRSGGTGRAYWEKKNADGSYEPMRELGDAETINHSQAITEETTKSNRRASKGIIRKIVTDRESTITISARELKMRNLQMALAGGTIGQNNQIAGFFDGVTKTWTEDGFIKFGKRDLFHTKIPGVITGTINVGDTVTGASSTETGKVAFVNTEVNNHYLLLVNVSGDFTVGEALEVDGANYLTSSGSTKVNDVIITDVTGATLRVQKTDYEVEPGPGFVGKISDGGLLDTDKVSADYAAKDISVMYGLAGGELEGRLTIITDENDQGPRFEITYHRYAPSLDGDLQWVGEGDAILALTGSLLEDTDQPTGQTFFEVLQLD